MTTLPTVYILPPYLASRVQPLFADQNYDQPFRDFVFEGKLDVPIVVDDPVAPTAAMLCHPFYYFLAGPVSPALRTFLKDAPQESGVFVSYYAYATNDASWREALTEDRPFFMVLDRVDFKWPQGQPAPEWRSHMPEGATLERVDAAMAARIDRELNEHMSANWGDYATFETYGDGLALMLDGVIACAAFTCGASTTQANVCIVTAQDYQGRGFATLTCAALIERLLARGLEPTWCSDAINIASGKLARKLGFVEDKPYLHIGPHWNDKLKLTSGNWQASEPDAEGIVAWTRVQPDTSQT